MTASNKHNMARHLRSKHLQIRYFCDECHAQFTAAEVLFCHKVTFHGAETPYVCQTCGKRYGWKSQLTKHEKQHSENRGTRKRRTRAEVEMERKLRETEPVRCNICQNPFSSAANLDRHVKLVHLKDRRFVCPNEGCQMSFGMKQQLTIHYRLHTG
jgi:uncharacterized Zn-finger protein